MQWQEISVMMEQIEILIHTGISSASKLEVLVTRLADASLGAGR